MATEATHAPSLAVRGRSPSSIMSKEEEEEMEQMVRVRRGERSSAFYGGIPPMSLVDQNASLPRSSGLSAPGFVVKPQPSRVLSHSARLQIGYADTIGKRPTMEDEITVVGQLRGPDDDYVGLFDGHGGNAAAIFAAKHLHEVLVEKLQEHSDPATALKQAFIATNEKMKEAQVLGGATALVFLLVKNRVYVANAGDSRAVLCRGGKAVRVSTDHKPETAEEEERILAAGGSVTRITNKQGKVIGRVNGMLAVSRALGDFMLQPYVTPEPEVQHFDLGTAGEQLILACDGVWDVLTDEDAATIVIKGFQTMEAAEECAVEIREAALLKQTNDNVSVVVISLPPNNDPRSIFSSLHLSRTTKTLVFSAAIAVACTLSFAYTRTATSGAGLGAGAIKWFSSLFAPSNAISIPEN